MRPGASRGHRKGVLSFPPSSIQWHLMGSALKGVWKVHLGPFQTCLAPCYLHSERDKTPQEGEGLGREWRPGNTLTHGELAGLGACFLPRPPVHPGLAWPGLLKA